MRKLPAILAGSVSCSARHPPQRSGACRGARRGPVRGTARDSAGRLWAIPTHDVRPPPGTRLGSRAVRSASSTLKPAW